jgi:hypothetical protein
MNVLALRRLYDQRQSSRHLGRPCTYPFELSGNVTFTCDGKVSHVGWMMPVPD